ncbi:MAG: dipicolinate synthase subunit DpsA, partial [Oscillospiraceae bacterium]
VIASQALVFNTVPAQILGEDVLRRVEKDCVLIDLASKPGGIDFEIAKKLNIKAIWALSLPGIVAPITAAQIIYDTVKNIIHERKLAYE